MITNSLSLFAVAALWLSATLLVSSPALQAESGLQFSAVADLVGQQEWGDNSSSSPWIEARGIEFMAYGPVDETFDALISAAAHKYRGDYFVELHEAFIESSRLVNSWDFKVGQFFIRQGRLNPLHPHDWNFVSIPASQEYFWDGEGIIDTGLEARYLLPTPFYLEWSGGLGSGWTFGHRHGDPGDKPKRPNLYTRLEHFTSFSESLGLKHAFNFFSRKDSDGIEAHLSGYDFILKKRASRFRQHLVESEIWTRYQKSPVEDGAWETAAYIYFQWALERRWNLGSRFDIRTNWEQSEKLQEFSNWLNLSYHHSEFSLFRLELGREQSRNENQDFTTKWTLLTQIVFFLGAHPAHEF